MRRLAQFCVRHGLLIRRSWFRNWITAAIFQPLHPRDAGLVVQETIFWPEPDGVVDLGSNVTPADVARFRVWWDETIQ